MTFHRSNVTKPGYIRVPGPCSRCGGAGWSEVWRATGGRCYRCGGHGQEPNGFRTYSYPETWTDQQVAEHAAKRAAQAEARRVAAEARKAAKRDAQLAEYGLTELVERRQKYEGSGFIWDVLWKANRGDKLTERQVQAVKEAAARWDAA